ncbi:transposase [Nocardia australiensis]|uniref:transposase n=1 Tax=Nocardia australiensis TaxID=2887191 RepID=UPI001D15175E|nr:transposase [Nocardia australiensis]
MTDAQWTTLEPLLPHPGNQCGKGGQPELHCRRAVLGAIFYIVRGGIAHRDGAHRLLAAMRAKFSTVRLVWADGGYTGRLVAWAKTVLAVIIRIVKRSDTATGFEVPARHWVVERTYAWITKHRRCVRDYETRPDHHEAVVHIAVIAVMSRRLART